MKEDGMARDGMRRDERRWEEIGGDRRWEEIGGDEMGWGWERTWKRNILRKHESCFEPNVWWCSRRSARSGERMKMKMLPTMIISVKPT
jgi:hypothetical protein